MTKTFRALILSGAALSFWGGGALAADVPVPVDTGNFYVGVFGGATWFNENGADFTIDGRTISDGHGGSAPASTDGPSDPKPWVHPDVSGDVSLDTDTGFLIGGVLGYKWGDTGLRTELELSYSQANLDGFDVDFDGGHDKKPRPMPVNELNGDGPKHGGMDFDPDFDGDVSVTYIFGNLWYDFGHAFDMGGISPYLGGGLGVGFVNIDIDAIQGIDFDASGSETGFAYQVGGGLMWHMADNIALDLGYRYRGVALDDYDQSLTSHNVLLGINFGF